MKIGTRIVLGFSVVMTLAVALGGLAVVKMRSVTQTANTLAEDYMPAIVAANEVERALLRSMYEMRGYGYTEDEKFLENFRKNWDDLKKDVKAAKELAAKATDGDLAAMKVAAEKVEAQVAEYEQLATQTQTVTAALNKARGDMDVSAQAYMKEASEYIKTQKAALLTALEAARNAKGTEVAAAAAEVADRSSKIETANDIVDLGNAIRVGNFKAQALRDPELFRETQKKFAEIDQKLNGLKAVTKQESNLKQIEACRAAGNAYNAAMTSFLASWTAREDLGSRRTLVGTAAMDEASASATASATTSGKASVDAASALSAASKTMLIGLGIVLVLGIAATIVISRSITNPIRAVATHLSAGAVQTASAAHQVSSGSQTLAEGASEQAASLEETSSSLEEMSSMTQRNAANARRANELAREARTAADAGAADMQQMATAMDAIKASSDDIAKIIKTIDEIAFQTNILALNAAVEAARAGEAGMGFAVVADEVRNLAQRSAQAAKETAAKIEGAIAKTGLGVEITAKVAHGLQGIVEKARQVDELVLEVTTASQEQSQGITQLNTAVSQMDKVVQSNAANAEEIASASEELNAQAGSLEEVVSDLLALVDGHKGRVPSHRAGHLPPKPASDSGRTSARETAPARETRKPAAHAVTESSNGHHSTLPPHPRLAANAGAPVVNLKGTFGKNGGAAAVEDAFKDF